MDDLLYVKASAEPFEYAAAKQQATLHHMQYDERDLAKLAATVAAGFARSSRLLDDIADKEKTRATARVLAKASVLVARHIMVASRSAAQKVDELELLYDDADFL